MTRRSRVVVPLLFGAALFAVYAFLAANAALIARAGFDPARVRNAAKFIALVPIIFAAVRLLDLLAFDVVAPRRRQVHAPMLLREIVSIALYFVLFGYALSAIFEYRVTAFLATGTVVAAVLGLALQETLGNLFAGIALHLEDSFTIGDVVRTGDYFGVVEAVRWRGTRIRTFNNNLVIVPNSILARERLEVFPRNNLNARVLQVGVDYHVPPEAVIRVLAQAAANVDGVSAELPVVARVGGFAESSVTYEVKYYTHDFSTRDRIDAEMRKAIWYALQRNQMPISFPVRAMQTYEPPPPRHVPQPDEIVDRLAKIDILSPLPRKAQQAIAAAARVLVFARGETIIRGGAAGDSMFVVHEGSVSVRAGGEEVATLAPGDFFGEMALLTGESRTADVVALTEVVAVEIAKLALQPVLQDHPELAQAISEEVTARRGDLDSRRSEEPEAQSSVLSRIRAYFGL
ncbi:MAG: mechanosensitive ion channel [Acidobacteria bacterium]|nr:mechanosensitive ion channel [Acidobacteriota bacterium]MBV9477805.1 mechanosensitive ion channel [Acidobacteriota bacterium]